MQYASKSIDLLIYHSSWQLEYYKRFYPWIVKKSVFIPFGIETETLDTPVIKRFEKIDKARPYIICVGKSRCDWDTVVKAYRQINTETMLCFLGGVDERFKNIENISMLPYVSFDEMRDLIEHAAFCVFL